MIDVRIGNLSFEIAVLLTPRARDAFMKCGVNPHTVQWPGGISAIPNTGEIVTVLGCEDTPLHVVRRSWEIVGKEALRVVLELDV